MPQLSRAKHLAAFLLFLPSLDFQNLRTLTVHFPLRVMAFMAAIPPALAYKLRRRDAWEMIGGLPFRCVVSVTTGVWVQQLLTTSSSQTHVVRHSRIEWTTACAYYNLGREPKGDRDKGL